MKTTYKIAILTSLLSCTAANAQWKTGDVKSSIDDGNETVVDLRNRYLDTRPDCGTANRPSLLCNGILIRTTKYSTAYHSWDPSPNAIKSGGMSFSYIRQDSKFKNLAWNQNSGLIFYPPLLLPTGKAKIDALCVFPMDAWGWHRDNACGSIVNSDFVNQTSKTAQSKPCLSQGITTAEQWKELWDSYPTNPWIVQCGFDIRKETSGTASIFNESIKAQRRLGETSFNEHNEVVLDLWNHLSPEQLPIQAFFYLNAALDEARHYQQDFYNTTQGIIVPIIRITPPNSSLENYIFDFIPGDQKLTGLAASGTTPAKCTQYIESARWDILWDQGTGQNQLTWLVTPTPCGRNIGSDQTDNAYTELVQKYGRDDKWPKDGGGSMRRQFVCHLSIARSDTTWNLEPFRPYVTHQQSIQEACNSTNPW